MMFSLVAYALASFSGVDTNNLMVFINSAVFYTFALKYFVILVGFVYEAKSK